MNAAFTTGKGMPVPKHLNLAVVAVAALAFVVGGCSSDDDSSSVTSTTATTAPTVTGADHGVGRGVADRRPSPPSRTTSWTPTRTPTVTINFGSSGQLATQITEGAPADVAAFADEAPMTTLDDAGLLAAPAQIFARNQLVIVTKPGNPKGITSLADLATVGTVSLCADDGAVREVRRPDPAARPA